MQFKLALLSFCLQASQVVAQGEVEPYCVLNNGGPDASARQAALDAFIRLHTGDGVLRIEANSDGPCVRCGNVDVSSSNLCTITYEASPESIQELFGEWVEGGDGCGGPLNTAEGAETGCISMIYGSVDYWDDECSFTC